MAALPSASAPQLKPVVQHRFCTGPGSVQTERGSPSGCLSPKVGEEFKAKKQKKKKKKPETSSFFPPSLLGEETMVIRISLPRMAVRQSGSIFKGKRSAGLW